jgi:hypothetical protein
MEINSNIGTIYLWIFYRQGPKKKNIMRKMLVASTRLNSTFPMFLLLQLERPLERNLVPTIVRRNLVGTAEYFKRVTVVA